MRKRKTTIAAVVVVLAALAAAGLFLLTRPPEVVETTKLIPPDAVLVLEIHRPVETWKAITTSRFGRELAASEFWERLGITPWLDDLDRQVRNSTGGLVNAGLREDLLGRGVALALLPSPLEGGFPALLGIARPGLRTRVLETVARSFDGLQRESGRLLRVQEYEGYRLVEIGPAVSSPFFTGYCLGDDFLAVVVSQDPPGPFLRRVIGSRARPETGPSLYHSERYRKTVGKLDYSPDDWLGLYFDFDRFRSLLAGLGDTVTLTGPEMLTTQWEELLDEYRHWWEARRFLGGRIFPDRGPAARLLVALDDDYAAARRASSPEEPRPLPLSLVPLETVFCLAGRLEPLKAWRGWREINRALSGGRSEGDYGLAFIEADAGISLEEDLLARLGGRAAIFLEDIDFYGLFPLPRVAAVVEARSAADLAVALDGMVARLVAAGHLKAPARMEYSGVEISFFPVPVFGQPAYALVEEFLVVGTSRELVIDLIDIAQGRAPSLLASPLFLELSSRVTPAAEEFGFCDTEKLVDRVFGLDQWFRELGLPPFGLEGEGEETLAMVLELLEVFGRSRGLAWNRRRVKNISLFDFYWYIGMAE